MGLDLKLKRATLSRDNLTALRDDERHLLVHIGFIANEISILNKNLQWSIRMPEQQGPESQAHLVVTGFNLRTLAGKLNEANKVIRRDYYNSGVAERWRGEIPEDLKSPLKSIKKYFKGESIIRDIRNGYAFHNPQIDVSRALEATNDSFDIYFAEANGNCLYMGPEILAMVSMLQKVDPDLSKALDKAITEIAEVAGWVLSAVNHFVKEIFRRNGYLDTGIELEEIVVHNAPDLDSVEAPFFVSSSRKRRGT